MFGKPQKALHLYIDEEKKNPKHIGVTYAVLEKFDGWYMYVDFIDGVWGDIKSRAGRIIPSVQHLNVFKEVTPEFNCRVIFEGTMPGKEFRELNGIFNRKAPVQEHVVFQVHDLISNPSDTFVERYAKARELVESLACPLVDLAEVLHVGSSKREWQDIYEQIVSRGGEGVILKEVRGLYQPNKRNHSLMKIKCEISLDLVVVGMVEGEGKYVGTLGALLVKDKFGIVHSVSGMTDKERHHFYNNPKEIMDKIVEVHAMKRISNGSLREARYKAIRHDKTIEEID